MRGARVLGLLLAGLSRILDQVTQPPYQPPNQPPYPPGYPQTPPYGYPQSPPPGYPPAYGPAYGWPPGYTPRGSSAQPGAPRNRRLLWTWIGFVGTAVVAFALAITFGAQWTLAARRLGQPDNTWATYGTVTAAQGSDVVVHVSTGTALVRRTETRVFNRTSSSTATTQVGTSFDSTIAGAPATSVGSEISFTYTSDFTHGTYLAVAPSRIKRVGTVPAEVGPLFIAGILVGLVGLILFIRWIVQVRRNRGRVAPMYSAPPTYWPPNPQQQ
jgi:hypothetical protein